MSGGVPLPDAMVIDLDLGAESGFELLRFWHSDSHISSIPLIVWTMMGERQNDICRLFGVNRFVQKDDSRLLSETLAGVIAGYAASHE